MDRRKMGRSAFFALISALVALITLVSSTYAWFTFHAYTNVTPLAGTISNGDGDLLIANSKDGKFDMTCELVLRNPNAELLPISTADLKHFYRVKRQDKSGVAQTYAEDAKWAEEHSLNGTVYLKAEGGEFDVYLWPQSVDCGNDNQALAAMRLGMTITTIEGVHTYIFKLDELGNTAGADSRQTVPVSGQVVGDLLQDGTAQYQTDPAVTMSGYAAGGTAEDVIPGAQRVCVLAEDEVASVEYWLYLEGCDDNCINTVQGRDIALQLGFAGAQDEK